MINPLLSEFGLVVNLNDQKDPPPDKGLYSAVIVRAIQDLGIQNSRGRNYRKKALEWLFGSDDFEEVCLYADVNPNRIRKFVRKNQALLSKGKSLESIIRRKRD